MTINFSSSFIMKQSLRIVTCYEKCTKESLRTRLGISDDLVGASLAKALYYAPQAILSHDIKTQNGTRDNVYNYANDTALTLFERSFNEQIALASSKSTQPTNAPQTDRNDILAQCLCQGWVTFSTTRYSSKGKPVQLNNAILFNLFDENSVYSGQAVVFEPAIP